MKFMHRTTEIINDYTNNKISQKNAFNEMFKLQFSFATLMLQNGSATP